MKESIRYRNTPKGIEFCHYQIQKDHIKINQYIR